MHHLQIFLSVNIENPWLYITLSLRTSTILTYLMDSNVGYFRGHCQCAASCDISVTITTERLSAAASARPHCQMKCHTLDVTHPSLLFSRRRRPKRQRRRPLPAVLLVADHDSPSTHHARFILSGALLPRTFRSRRQRKLWRSMQCKQPTTPDRYLPVHRGLQLSHVLQLFWTLRPQRMQERRVPIRV